MNSVTTHKYILFLNLPVNISCCLQPPQFVDIQLEEEDSSDEEYCPDEEEEDETAEEVSQTGPLLF